jgi:predicted RNA-binding protein with TRAM domain
MERHGFKDNVTPVNVGEEIDVKIEAVGEKGDGIARKKGFVLFIPNTKEGDEVRVKITRVLKKVGFAEVVGKAKSTPQPERTREIEKEKPKKDDLVPEGDDSEDFGEEPTEEEAPVEEVADDETEEVPKPDEEESNDDLEEPPVLEEEKKDMDEPPAP